MAERKVGMDVKRASTLVMAYQVASWERNEAPEAEKVAALDAQLAQDPENWELWMNRGIQIAFMGYPREAVECFSRAIAINPFHWELYRHRGHRFVSCGYFADGAADFRLASRLKPDDWNVWYHLGLSYFLLEMYEEAAEAYAQCLALSKTADDVVAVTDWYWMTLKRLGKDPAAAALLEGVTEGMPVNDEVAGSYYRRLKVYKGILRPETLLGGMDSCGIPLGRDISEIAPLQGTEGEGEYPGLVLVTQGFGLANYYDILGEREKSNALLKRVIETAENSRWYSAFGCLAAHVDLKRRGIALERGLA